MGGLSAEITLRNMLPRRLFALKVAETATCGFWVLCQAHGSVSTATVALPQCV